MKPIEISILDLANELKRLANGVVREVQQEIEPPVAQLKNPIGFSQPTCSSKENEVKRNVVADGLDARHDNLRLAIAEHFSENCEPSVPLYMVDLALEAIDAVLRGDGSVLIDLPPGVTWRDELTVTAQSAVESLCLGAFVDVCRSKNK